MVSPPDGQKVGPMPPFPAAGALPIPAGSRGERLALAPRASSVGRQVTSDRSMDYDLGRAAIGKRGNHPHLALQRNCAGLVP